MESLAAPEILATDPPRVHPSAWSFVPRALSPVVLSAIVAILMYAVVAPRVGGFGADVLANCGIAIVMAVSLTVVNGFTGQFSIGHAGFMSVGGYVAASLLYYGSFHVFGDFDPHGGWFSAALGAKRPPHWFTEGDALFVAACLIGGIISAVVGYLVGLPSLRLRGDYLAIVTLGFGEIVRVLIQGTPDQLDTTSVDPAITEVPFFHQLDHVGGALGFTGGPAYTTNFWIWLVTAITLAATIRLKYSGYGRTLLSIREDDIAARAVGVNITRLKVRAFMYGAFFAGVGGALYAMKIGTINAGEMGFQRSFDFVIMVVLGGLGSISGAAIAAILLTLLPELLRAPPDLWPWGWAIAVGVAVLILLMAPKKKGPLLTLLGLCLGWEAMRWGAIKASIDLSQYRMVIYSLALIIIMIVRPQGLFGLHEIWDYLPAKWQRWNRPAAGGSR